MPLLLASLAVCALCAIIFASKLLKNNRLPLPPGPPGEPLLGNIRSLPSKDFDIFLHDLGKTYGDITYLNLLGKGVLALNRLKPAVDLLEKRGSKYSGRPQFPLAEVQKSADMLLFLDYGDEFRHHRRAIHNFLQKENISNDRYTDVYAREARRLVQRLVAQPESWSEHVVVYSTTIIVELAFGHQIKSEDDPYLKIIDDFCKHAATCVKPDGGALVEFWPFLKHVPSWFPGGYWVGRARRSRQYVRKFKEYPHQMMQRKMAEGTAQPCFLLTQLESLRDKTAHPAMTEDSVRAMACVLYIAGADTSSSSLSSFFAAMVLYPSFQDKAREEIDRVLGLNRLPMMEDRPSLPYVEGILQETLRWRPPVPLAIPHYSTEDDIYGNAFIPKGTTIIPNIRGMGLDEEVYKDPFTFDPERYGRGEPRFSAVWGFGRRICPGRHLAEQSLWITIATILATVTIQRPRDEAGKEIVPSVEFETGITCQPRPFTCRIKAQVCERAKAALTMKERR